MSTSSPQRSNRVTITVGGMPLKSPHSSELALETFLPGDEATAQTLTALAATMAP